MSLKKVKFLLYRKILKDSNKKEYKIQMITIFIHQINLSKIIRNYQNQTKKIMNNLNKIPF